MQKVLIVGSPGAGKSVLARRLHAATGLPLHYLDCLWHRPDGGHVTAADFDRALAQVLAQQRWIVDGNYLRTLPVRLAACDTVLWLDPPVEVCLAGAAARIGRPRPDLPWVEQALDPEFAQYIRDFPAQQRPQLAALLAQRPAQVTLHRFAARADADRWLDALPAAPKGPAL